MIIYLQHDLLSNYKHNKAHIKFTIQNLEKETYNS